MRQRRTAVVLALVLVLLSGCGGGAISRADLETLLIQPGDLPPDVQPGQLSDGSTSPTDRAQGFTLRVRQDMHAAGDRSLFGRGYVAIMIYDDPASLERNFTTMLPGITTDGQPLDGLGDRAAERDNVVIFTRCRALVAIMLPTTDSLQTRIGNYAQRLDERIRARVC